MLGKSNLWIGLSTTLPSMASHHDRMTCDPLGWGFPTDSFATGSDPCMLLRLDPWNSIDFLLNTTPLLVTSLLGRTWSNIFKLGDFDAFFFDDSGLTSTCLSRRQWQGISGFGGKKQHNRHGFTRARNHVWEMYEAMAVYHHVSCFGPLFFSPDSDSYRGSYFQKGGRATNHFGGLDVAPGGCHCRLPL